MEIIKEINEIHGFDGDNYGYDGYYDEATDSWIKGTPPGSYPDYDGYEIVTDKQRIFFGISNMQNCCENWGYLTTVDDATDYIGAKLVEITQTNTDLKTGKVDTGYGDEQSGYYENVVFVNFVTDRGVFQLTAYNQHNGYYGHTVTMKSEQLSFNAGV